MVRVARPPGENISRHNESLATGTYDSVADAIPYPEMNAMLR
jgi:hypothetical protein